jgi:CheY-like chemotaxis protein
MPASAPRVLIIDDSGYMRDLLRLHLKAAGYEVELAEDAVVAGHSILRAVPDLIICDVDMPHMDGFEFLAALKADPSIPDVPVIFLTSITDGRERARELGARAYLVKPLLLTELLATVARHIPGGPPEEPSVPFLTRPKRYRSHAG